MINLICTHCQNTLEIDDAFAGGVCRCQHCGTIQTVPRAGIAAKTLYKQKARPETVESSGLEDLANIVTSSGLESGRLRSDPQSPAKSQAKRAALLLAVAGAVIFFLGIALIALLVKEPTTPAPPRQAETGELPVPPSVAAPSKPQSPNFLDIPLSETTVVYLLDRGDSSREIFGHLKNAVYKSIESLGPSRRFQILFWNNGEEAGFPLSGPVTATPENLNAARRALEDVAAFGKTDVLPALKKAASHNPPLIVIATGKSWDLDDEFARQVVAARGEWPIKVHTFAIGDPGTGAALKSIAEKTGGQYQAVSPSALRDYAAQ